MGFTQGLLATPIADAAPAERRGAAFGMFNQVTPLLVARALKADLCIQRRGPTAGTTNGATALTSL
ncbi:hypothetical protein N183_33645 [Sinorhizobium sp. Sb3]|uniref:hypothetical protein n=1 Tax=Sinorhizobium/Ensifer group TaxID=227292 RepID=UPI00071DE879|nr:hypothetical protein N183_33645 [Sinorhizobium sp. Sb3]